jgi:hypothetical protein
MAKVTIIGATGNVGMFAAHAISAIPYVSEILLYGREGRESLLKGITQDLLDSFAARGTDIRTSWTTNLTDVSGSRPGRTGLISRWAMQKLLPRSQGPLAQLLLTPRFSWLPTRSIS